MDSGPGSGTPSISSKRVSSSISTSPFTTSSGTEERRRKRSNTISGPHPLEFPITRADHQLASLIDRLNFQNARAAAAEAAASEAAIAALPAYSVPQVLLPLTYQRGSTKSCEAGDLNDLEEEKTPTQEDFAPSQNPLHPSTAVQEDKSLQPSRGRNFACFSSARRLSPIGDDCLGGATTPTRSSPIFSQFSSKTSPAKAFSDDNSTTEAIYTSTTTPGVESAAFPLFDPNFPLAITAQSEGSSTEAASIESSTSNSFTGTRYLADRVCTTAKVTEFAIQDSALRSSAEILLVKSSIPFASLSSKTASVCINSADN